MKELVMHRFIVFCGVLLLHLFFTSMGLCDSPLPIKILSLPVSPSSINVRSYGAKGDGATDDTQAIQSAVNAALSQQKPWGMRVLHWNHLTRGATDSPNPEIVFPAGIYNVSRPIVFSRFASLRGIDNAVIQQTDPTQDIFYFHATQRTIVENLNFKGGKIQLRIWTNNIGPATVSASHCTFSDSADYAIECRSYTKQRGDLEATKPWAPYEVEWVNGFPKLTANTPDGLVPWFNSTLASISHCRFDNTMHGADIAADTGVVRDCEIATNPQMEGSFFRLGGNIHLTNVKALAKLGMPKQPYWIQAVGASDGTLISVRNSSFDTNAPQGMGLIHSGILPGNSSIIVDNTRVKSAGAPEGAVIWIEKGTQPNILSLSGLTEISGKPVKAVAWEQIPDVATLEAIKDRPKGAPSNLMYKIEVSGNGAGVDNAVPAIFALLSLPPIPAVALQKTYVAELLWNYETVEEEALKNGKVLLATDFGVDQDAKTDDTVGVQKAFAAATQGGHILVFPAGIITISDTIALPSNVVVRGAGMTSFLMENTEKDMFSCPGATSIAFKNCAFNGGRNAFDIHSPAAQKTRIGFDNCSFFDQADNGIQALSGNGRTGELNQTEISVKGGIFASMHGLTTNAAQAQISDIWAVNDPRLDNEGFIKNQGGKLRIENILTNPKLWQGKRSEGKVPPDIKDWQWSKNTRWVDNWGQLYIVDSRFGGECGGMCSVFNLSEQGTVYIGGGISYFYNGATRKTILYLEKAPLSGVLSDIASPAVKIEDAQSAMNPDGSSATTNPQIIVSGVPAP